jgi:very-short-patch-repair endonuclease
LWKLEGGPEASVVEVSTPRHVRSVRLDTKVRRVRSLPDGDVRIVGGLPVTSVARTIVELAGIASAGELELAFESALRRRILTIPQLRTQIGRSPSTAPGIGLVRALVSQGPMAPTESILEAALWRLLRRSGLPLPDRQHEVRDQQGRLVARLDFAYPEARIAIEADGYRFHSGRRDWRRDIERHNALTELGWTMLRVTWDDVQRREVAVVRRLRRLLSDRLAAP